MRYLKFLLCIALFGAFGQVNGQIYINSYRFLSGGELLLDNFPGASVAFSFRKLRTAYTGNCIQVLKDSTGDQTKDIGFLNNYLDTAELKTFCKSNTCRIKIWYDQSGNGRNVSQATKSNQPIIYTSSVLIKDNSKVAAKFDGVTNFLSDTTAILATNNPVVSFFGIAKKLTRTEIANDFAAIFTVGATTGNFYIPVRANSNTEGMQFRAEGGTNSRSYSSGSNFTNNVMELFSSLDNATNVTMYRNNAEILAASATSLGAFVPPAQSGFQIGHLSASLTHYWLGNISEIILYTTDKSADKTDISNNINTFYTIY